MISLLRLFTLRHSRRHRGRALLALASIALGVALFVSIRAAHLGTRAAYEAAHARLAGGAELRVTRGRHVGIEEAALARIEGLGLVAVPGLETTLRWPDLGESQILVLGVDFRRRGELREVAFAGGAPPARALLDPRSLWITRSLARRHGLEIGSTVRSATPLGERELRIAGLVDDRGPTLAFGGRVAVMEIRALQKLISRVGSFDRIDIVGAVPEAAAAELRGALGEEVRVRPAVATNSVLEEALARLEALVVVSLIAFLIGLFIVYLSVTTSVDERAGVIATLRAVGASRRQILTLVLLEAGALGLLGSAAGVLLGWVLARGLVALVERVVNTLVFVVEVEALRLPPTLAATALAAGVLVSLAAGLGPALRAVRIPPLAALRPTASGVWRRRQVRRWFVAGAAASLGGGAATALYPLELPVWGALVGAALALAGAAAMMPQVAIRLSLALRPLALRARRIEGFVAGDSMVRHPSRTALTVVALGGALSLLVITASVVLSFRTAIDHWIRDALPFDLSLQAGDLSQGLFGRASLPGELRQRAERIEGVAEVYAIKESIQELGAADVMLLAIDMEIWLRLLRRAGSPLIPAGASIAALENGRAVWVSSNFAALHQVRRGDEIELVTARGRRRFAVACVIPDYKWPQGVIGLDLATYRRLWQDSSLTYIDVEVAPGASPAAVKARLVSELGAEHELFVYSTDDLRRFAYGALDRFFQLTHVLVALAMVIGFLGIANTLLISVLARRREIGLLRAVGMSRRQVARAVTFEAMVVSLLGCAFGVLAGLAAAAWPVSRHLLRTTGYALPFEIPWLTLGASLAAALLIGYLASLWPARQVARLDVLEAIGYE